MTGEAIWMEKSRKTFLSSWHFSKDLNTVRKGAMETLQLGEECFKQRTGKSEGPEVAM